MATYCAKLDFKLKRDREIQSIHMKEEILKWVAELETISNPSDERLREMARKDELTTEYGSPSYITIIRSRSAKFTQIVEEEPTRKQVNIILAVRDYLRKKRVISVDRTMCKNTECQIRCRLIVTEPFARLAYMWSQTLFSSPDGAVPDILTIYVPEWQERRVLVLADAGVTFILGADYLGEAKKSFLRMGMYVAKKKGGLGLHAASKILRFKDVNRKIKEKGAILFGLSGTGKTTLSCHEHGLKGEEGIIIRQDDVCFLQKDGSCIGTEDNFYIKTEGLEPLGQPLLYRAAVSPNAILENIMVDKDGKVDFLDYTLTSNGRCIVRRLEMAHTDNEIDIPKAHIAIFITRRNDIVPPVAKLNPVWGAAAFMLGESIETSAGDPAEAGQSKRVVGTNPFIVGPEYEEGNYFYEILQSHSDMECYLINTGIVGESLEGSILIKHSTGIIREIARGGIRWEYDPDWGYEVATSVRGVDIRKLNALLYYSRGEYEEKVRALKRERLEWLDRFPGLHPHILKAIRS